jgi:hypothetical protein
VRRVVYEEDAELDLLRLPPDEADAVWLAVNRFATTGVGFLRRMDGGGLSLYSGSCVVSLVVTVEEVRVLAVVTRH